MDGLIKIKMAREGEAERSVAACWAPQWPQVQGDTKTGASLMTVSSSLSYTDINLYLLY